MYKYLEFHVPLENYYSNKVVTGVTVSQEAVLGGLNVAHYYNFIKQ